MLTREALNRRYAKMDAWPGRSGPYQSAIKRYVDFGPESVLDVGCALGDPLLKLQRRWPNALLGGIDTSGVAIEKAQARLGEQSIFWVLDIAKKRPSIQAFDLVLCIQTLEHLSPSPLVVTQVVEWLKGLAMRMLIITVPYRFAIREPDHRMFFGIRSFDGLQPTLVEHMGEKHIAAMWRKSDATT